MENSICRVDVAVCKDPLYLYRAICRKPSLGLLAYLDMKGGVDASYKNESRYWSGKRHI